MFVDLSDLALADVITKLRDACINLAAGVAVAEIHYDNGGRKFHPASLSDARDMLNEALAEKSKRASTSCGPRSRAIHPRGV